MAEKREMLPDEVPFLQVSQEHQWRRMLPHFVKMSLALKLKTATSAIKHVSIVSTGFVTNPENEAARNMLLQEAHHLDRTGLKLESASN